MDEKKYQVLVKFFHGLGDHAQFTVVLKHLQKYRPNWDVDVRCGRGKHTMFRGLCRTVYPDNEPEPTGHYDSVIEVGFYENYNRYSSKPNSKVTNCLAEVFGIEYDAELERYTINVSDEAKAKAAAYFDSIGAKRDEKGRYNVFVLHYEGNTSQHKKNLNWHQANALCGLAIDRGLVPVILDWDKRSPLPDGKRIFCPAPNKPEDGPDLWGNFGSGDGEVIAALISQASLFVGVDSGPGKCASATDTPTLICWKEMHPMQFHDPAPNTTHLLPDTWTSMPPCEHPDVRECFARKYEFITYDTKINGEHALAEEAMLWMQKALTTPLDLPKERGDLIYRWGFWMPKFHDLFCFWNIIEDVYLRDAYKCHLRPKAEGVEYVVDIGANIGTFGKFWHKRNPLAKIASVEVNEKLISALKANVAEFSRVFAYGCHYTEPDCGPVYLLDCLTKGSCNVGDSRLIDHNQLQRGYPQWYTLCEKPIQTLTLEEVCRFCEFPRIDVLKLDCEGSEINILRHCDLSKIGTILVESHDPDAWRDLQARRFRGWDIGHMHKSECGRYEIHHLVNPAK